MEIEPIEVYSHATNSCIVKMPERQYPGVVIQGDSLASLLHIALGLVEKLEGKTDEETFLGALEVAEALEAHLLNYEKTLRLHKIELPYRRDTSRNTGHFQKYWNENDV